MQVLTAKERGFVEKMMGDDPNLLPEPTNSNPNKKRRHRANKAKKARRKMEQASRRVNRRNGR